MVNHMKRNKKSIHFPPYIRFYAQKKENLILIPLSFLILFFSLLDIARLSIRKWKPRTRNCKACLPSFLFFFIDFYFFILAILGSLDRSGKPPELKYMSL